MHTKPFAALGPLPAARAAFAALAVVAASDASAACPLPPHTAPATYYVATRTTGDGTGQLADPFGAFATALACANPATGDTIVILGAYHLPGQTDIDKDNLTIRGKTRLYPDRPAEPSQVTCASPAVSCFKLRGRNRIAFFDIYLRGGTRAPIDIGYGSSSIRIERNVLRHGADATGERFGLYVWADADRRNADIVIRGNDVASVNTGIYTNRVDRLTIENNRVHDIVAGDGIVAERIATGRVAGNKVERLVKAPAGATCNPAGAIADGIKLRESDEVEIRANIVRDVTGSGIKVRRVDPANGTDPGMPPSTRITVADNEVSNVVRYFRPELHPGGCASGWPGALVLSYIEDLTLAGNQVRQNWGEGVTINSSSGVRVEANDFRDNFSANIYLNNLSDAEVRRNFVSHTDGATAFHRFGLPAIGIGMANEKQANDPREALNFRPLRNIVIADNIVRAGRVGINHYWSGASGPGVQQYHFSGLQNLRIFNNTVRGELAGPLIAIAKLDAGSFEPPRAPHQDIHVNANIFVQQGAFALRRILAGAPEPSPVRYAGNTWHRPSPCAGCDAPATIAEDSTYDPLFAAAPGAEPAGYKIQAGSSARDAAAYSFVWGGDPGRDFFGTVRPALRRDVGAHEVAP